MRAQKARAATWRVGFSVPAELNALVGAWADETFPTHSAFEQPDNSYRYDLLVIGSRPEERVLELELAILAKQADLPAPLVDIEEVPDADWRAVTYAAFPPVTIGRVVIHGSHHADAVPVGKIGLQIDAATAFGTGEHPTTAGCLLALQDLSRRHGFRPKRLIDLGTGTGVLGMAMVRLWKQPVVATDVDAEAVRVSRQNALDNRLAGWMRIVETGQVNGRAIGGRHSYDLVVANILARPLIGLSRDIARLTSPGSFVVLSGLLSRQSAAVLAFYRLQGLRLIGRKTIGEWSTLTLRAP